MRRAACIALVMIAATSRGQGGASAKRQATAAIDFAREIRPILSENCFTCHGPDESQRKAKLRLDTRDGALGKLRRGGHAVVPGIPGESALLHRILATDAEERMPPATTNKRLSPQQIDLIKRWIDEGAPWS